MTKSSWKDKINEAKTLTALQKGIEIVNTEIDIIDSELARQFEQRKLTVELGNVIAKYDTIITSINKQIADLLGQRADLIDVLDSAISRMGYIDCRLYNINDIADVDNAIYGSTCISDDEDDD